MTAWPDLLQLLVIALAVARVTRLIADDAILDVPRGLLLARLIDRPMLTTLLTCHWCLGWWLALAWSGAWWAWPGAATAVAVPWAVALVAWWTAGSWLTEDRGE